jgi:hypothetical protein
VGHIVIEKKPPYKRGWNISPIDVFYCARIYKMPVNIGQVYD